jgi:hypothetical protein
MSKIENIVQHILDTQPHTHANNTELCIAVWKEVAKRRNTFPYCTNGVQYAEHDFFAVIRDYPPESITRKRRELVKSTKEQHEKGYQVYKHYATGVGSNPLD